MKDNFWLIIWAAVIGGGFALAWRKGYLKRLADYVAETREELRKCNWPTSQELRASTAVVVVAVVLLGGFTVAVDFIVVQVLKRIM